MAGREFGDNTRPQGGARPGEKTQTSASRPGDAFENVADTARGAASQLKDTVAETATTATDHVKELLDRQIGSHISAAGILAGAVKRAADDIEEKSPLAAGFVRKLSDRVEEFALTYEDETVEQLVRSASDFTRREPALVFGLAAFAGFLVYRTLKSVPTQAPPLQPSEGSRP